MQRQFLLKQNAQTVISLVCLLMSSLTLEPTFITIKQITLTNILLLFRQISIYPLFFNCGRLESAYNLLELYMDMPHEARQWEICTKLNKLEISSMQIKQQTYSSTNFFLRTSLRKGSFHESLQVCNTITHQSLNHLIRSQKKQCRQ